MSQSLQESAFPGNHLPAFPGGDGIRSKSSHGSFISCIFIYCLSSNFAFVGLSDFPHSNL